MAVKIENLIILKDFVNMDILLNIPYKPFIFSICIHEI